MKVPIIILICVASPFLAAESFQDDGTGHWLIKGFEAQEAIQNQKYTKKEYGDWCEVLGFISGVSMMGNGKYWIYPTNNTKQQFIAIIVKYMNAHPEQ